MLNLKGYIAQPFEFEAELQKLFKANENLTIFDVGACEGEDSIKFSNRFPNARIYAFEPLPKNIASIKENFKPFNKSKIQLIQKALSDKKGEATFYVSSGSPNNESNEVWDYGNKSSSLLAPAKTKKVHTWLKFNEKITVKTERVDNFMQKEHISKVDFMYMDVQGAELKVLEGAGEYIKSIRAIWLEVESIELYKNQPLKQEVENFMGQHGFRKIKDTVNTVSGDQLYVNDDLYNKLVRSRYYPKAIVRGGARRVKGGFRNIQLRISQRVPITRYGLKKRHKQISFSQSGEDMILKHIFDTKGMKKISYLDVGAHDPFYINNTAIFYKSGSRGVNIEPDPLLFKNFQKYRKKDHNLNIGIANKPGKLKFYIMVSRTLNTFSEKEALEYVEKGYPLLRTQTIKVNSINNIVKKYFSNKPLDLLSIDVEGMDYEILRAFDFNIVKPKVICAETVEFTEDGTGEKDQRITDLLISRGYRVYADTKINTIYVSQSA